MNPLAQLDKKSDVPPQAQMMIKNLQAQNQQMQQQMQQMQMAMKQRQDIEQVKQQAETQREMMRQTTKVHDTNMMADVKVMDQNTRSITAQNKIEIDAIMELMLHHMDTARLEREIAMRNQEQYKVMSQSLPQ
jgi:hypothetical protein